MSPSELCLDPQSVITGWDFSTSAVKCLAFDLGGNVLAEVRLPTDIWQGDPPNDKIRELSLLLLEGQARATTRGIAAQLRGLQRLQDWVAGGISATHHTAGRIDAQGVPVRRAICWNDQTLAAYRVAGEARLGGPQAVKQLIGGPWADRYTLSHLVKDEDAEVPNEQQRYLRPQDWQRTYRILLHGPLAAGYLTGNFDVTSLSSAASTGILSFVTRTWKREMLGALADEQYRELAWKQLPQIIDHCQPIGLLAEHLALEAGVELDRRPTIYPTSDDQQAGLVGGGAVNAGQMAIVLGTSAVVNSSSAELPDVADLDVMCLNWGPYLLMRCYSNGAGALDDAVEAQPNWGQQQWEQLEQDALAVPPGADGSLFLPFVDAEPSLGIHEDAQGTVWLARNGDGWAAARPPEDRGVRRRASLEALAYLIALGVRSHLRAHERIGQTIDQISVSGGASRSDLMCEILASVLGRNLHRLANEEGPALGAAATAMAAHETNLRRQRGIQTPFSVADAVATMVKFREPVRPNPRWQAVYEERLAEFEQQVQRRAESFPAAAS